MSQAPGGPSPEPAPEPPLEPGPVPVGAPELDRDAGWQRLDRRMLLVQPVREVGRFLPALIGVFVFGAASGGRWQLVAVAVPVVLGLARYLTTTFRVRAGRVELRRGLLSRHVLSTPLDRVRTVDLTASPVHRLLGLTTVRIGTGTASTRGEDRLDLDGLPVARARELRTELLRVSPVADGPVGAPADGSDPAAPVAPVPAGPADPVEPAEPPVAVFTPAWLRFAPFTSGGVVIGAAVLGLVSQLGDDVGLYDRLDPDRLPGRSASPYVLVPLAVLGVVAAVSLLAVAGYLLANAGYVLRRTRGRDGAAWHVRRGLLTTRETTLDLDRVAGVVLGEPAGLRLAGGRRLSAIVTGLGADRQSGALVPPAPRDVVRRAARAVVGSDAVVDGPLVDHGPRARTRRWTRALVPAAVPALAAVVAVALGAPTWLLAVLVVLPVAAGLALDRSRALGHALVDGYVVSRSGSLLRRRAALSTEHVIGWNLVASFWQRRAGLVTLVATTAGGGQRVVLLDVPEAVAVRLAATAQPGLLEQFSARTAGP